MSGKLIVFEGTDGSGKATQAKLLAAHLAGSGRRVMEITFPDYESDSSALVKMYLSGQFGDKPDDESKKDIQEKDTEYLARSRRAAEYCAEHLGWATVHCTADGAMRTIEDIQAEVQALAGNVLG